MWFRFFGIQSGHSALRFSALYSIALGKFQTYHLLILTTRRKN